jgi:hypothetical protein
MLLVFPVLVTKALHENVFLHCHAIKQGRNYQEGDGQQAKETPITCGNAQIEKYQARVTGMPCETIGPGCDERLLRHDLQVA